MKWYNITLLHTWDRLTMPPGGDSTSSMRFQAAMHQIGDLQTQIQELQQKNKVLTQHNQELQEKLQLCSHQVRSYEQSLPSHFQQVRTA